MKSINKYLKLLRKQDKGRKVIIAAKSLIGIQILEFKKGVGPEKSRILARRAINVSINLAL